MPSKPTTIESYLGALPLPQRAQLDKLRQVLRKAVPNAEEVISYSMPAFRQEGIVVWYAAAKNHYAVYVYPRIKTLFTKELAGFKGTKSSIHFGYGKRVPVKLITSIVKESLRQNLTKASNPKTNKLKAFKK